MGMASRVREFRRKPAAGRSARCPRCAGAPGPDESAPGPEACEHHAGGAEGARLRGELPEVFLRLHCPPCGRRAPP
eukprot:7018480-Alexandrium_andersonii.AAC.1